MDDVIKSITKWTYTNDISQELQNILDQMPQSMTDAAILKVTDVINNYNLFTISVQSPANTNEKTLTYQLYGVTMRSYRILLNSLQGIVKQLEVRIKH